MKIVWQDEPCFIRRQAVRDIVNLALGEEPREMCGVLAGQARVGDVFLPVSNDHHDPERFYAMDSASQMDTWQRAMRHGGVSAIVHSHTSRDAYPSASDIRYAAYPQLFYVILSLEPRQLRAFSIDRQRYVGNVVWEHPVHIDHSKAGLLYCWVHARYEDASGYLVCGECQHSFRTWQDLVADHNAVVNELDMASVQSPQDVVTCPHCTHDF